MDGELLSYLYHRLMRSSNPRHVQRCTFNDGLIVLIYFYAVLCNRSPRWACQRCNWPVWLRRLRLPSYSQMMRRLKHPSVGQLIEQIDRECRDRLPRSDEKICDGKPLVVSGFSKDPDARLGKIPGGWGRGYKLHAMVDSLGVIEAFAVTGLNAGEATVMCQLVSGIELSGAIVRADANYDSNRLYHQVADSGGRLIAPRRKPWRGLSKRKHHPHRLQAIAELESTAQLRQIHKRIRVRVEQTFAHLTNLPFGLAPLPNFVRRLRRVTLWVKAKIVLYHVSRILRCSNALAA
jgi:hypothetical protein